MDTDINSKRDEALSFLVGHTTGVLATTSQSGQPRARLIYYTADDAFNLYFITLANTRKASDLIANPHAAFVISETDAPRTIQLEGVVTDLTDSATIDPTLIDLVHVLLAASKYGPPITRFDAGEMRFYKFAPDWVRWGNFTFGRGSASVFTQIDPNEKEG